MKCPHNLVIVRVVGSRFAVCSLCGMWGPPSFDDMAAKLSFWQSDADKTKPTEEKTMASEYRRGVEDATKPLIGKFDAGQSMFKHRFDEEVAERRKTLLTKKVTKWVNVYQGMFSPDGLTAGMSLFSVKEDAERAGRTKLTAGNHIGTYPVEIEVAVD